MRRCTILGIIGLCGLILMLLGYMRLQSFAWSRPDIHDQSGLLVTDIDWMKLRHFDPNNAISNDGTNDLVAISHSVHAFYYAWYNAPYGNNTRSDTRFWKHWNHRRLPVRIPTDGETYFADTHRPPHDIGASFYPKLGPYASADTEIMQAHFRMSTFAGIGVWVMSWYPSGMADENGRPVDQLVLPLLSMASSYGMKLCLHIEPYIGRTAATIVDDLKYALNRGYTTHPAYYRLSPPRQEANPTNGLPVFFIYDSYTINFKDWTSILTQTGTHTIRGQVHDAYMIGLLIDVNDCVDFQSAGFDGGYTYFVGQGTTAASMSVNWDRVSRICHEQGVHFYPSIGPGYSDVALRPWNARSTVNRQAGYHYRDLFLKALDTQPNGLGITSFNEWGEGTQIESAKPYKRHNTLFYSTLYLNYSPFSADFYLRLTRLFVNKFSHLHVIPVGYDLAHWLEQSHLIRINSTL